MNMKKIALQSNTPLKVKAQGASTTKRESQKRNSYFSFANERREQIQSSGFTLVETMIAVTILTFAVAGPLFTASRALVAAEIARDQLTASYLAQEGVEYVRAMRDTEYLAAYQTGGATVSETAWSSFLNGSNAGSITQCRTSTCTLDPSRNMGTGSGYALVPCSGEMCSPLYLTNGIYTTQSEIPGAELTSFTRTIQAVDVSAGDERIVSRVSWSFHETPYIVTVTSHLTPWQ